MKSILKITGISLLVLIIFASCKKDDNNETKKLIVKLGAQSNTTVGAFYSFGENKVYMQDIAATKQDTIEFLCFYEHDEVNNRINDITLSSPGANITGIFGGTSTDPANWTTKNLTKFQAPNPAISVEEFDLLEQNDAVIESYFDNTVTSGNKKAKLLTEDDIYAFKTHNNVYGLLKVLEVVEGANGYVKFEIKYVE